MFYLHTMFSLLFINYSKYMHYKKYQSAYTCKIFYLIIFLESIIPKIKSGNNYFINYLFLIVNKN